MVIWSTKSQHTHNTSKCAEFDGGFEFSQQIVIWQQKNQQKDSILITHRNVQNLTADSNLVKKRLVTLKKGFFIKATGGWVFFYVTFSLNASKTII